MSRNNTVILIVGNRGRGKTDFTKDVISSSSLPKALIVDTFDNPAWDNMACYFNPSGSKIKIPTMELEQLPYWKKGIYKLFSSDTDAMKEAIDLHVRNTIVVFEDATKYVGSRLTEALRKFVLDTKQKNVDAIFIFHSVASIPPELMRVADILTLFKTGDSLRKISSKYDNPEIAMLFEQVQKNPDRYYNQSIRLN